MITDGFDYSGLSMVNLAENRSDLCVAFEFRTVEVGENVASGLIE